MKQEKKRRVAQILNSENSINKDLSANIYNSDNNGIYWKRRLTALQVSSLTSEGFKLIFPALLSEEYVEGFDAVQEKAYQEFLNYPLIIDTSEPLSIDLAYEIMQHKFRLAPFGGEKGVSINGKTIQDLDMKENSIKVYPGWYHNLDYSIELQAELQQLGYNAEIDETGAVKVFSAIPYNGGINQDKISTICRNAVMGIRKIS